MPISALAIRRITIDTKRVQDLTESGLYWYGDELDITHGWAMVGGCEGTPYAGGSYCFEVWFPDNYPFEPPKMQFLTNDGRTRFNPNLYKNGKVCLSLLGTWAGEPWSAVQSLSSVLQSIQTVVLCEEPLINEPVYSKMKLREDSAIYNRLITHSNIETAILGQLADPPPFMLPFYDVARAWAFKHRDAVIRTALAFAADWDGKSEANNFYNMSQRYRFRELAEHMLTFLHHE